MHSAFSLKKQRKVLFPLRIPHKQEGTWDRTVFSPKNSRKWVFVQLCKKDALAKGLAPI